MHPLNSLSWKQWSLTVKLTVTMTTLLVTVVASVTLLAIRREQQAFRTELQQQAGLLLATLAASAADPLYTLDTDALSDMVEALGVQALGADRQILASGRVYDANGRIVGDAYDPLINFNLEPDPFGQQLVKSDTTIFAWQAEQLVAGRAVIVGPQRLGAVSVGLPTMALQAKLVAVRNQGLGVALAAALSGALLALFLSRSITGPLQDLVQATQRIATGDLSRAITTPNSGDELTVLGQAMEQMRNELQELYRNLEQQVTQRTTQLTQTNQQLRHEIAERKQAEQALAAARDQALQSSRLKSQLLAKVSHELRTPLGAILGYSELLQEGNFGSLSEEQLNTIAKVIHSSNYLTKLVNELLDQAQFESGQTKLRLSSFALRDMLEQVETKMSVLAQAKGLTLTLTIAPEMPISLNGDENRLEQILMNLVSNAIKFTPAGTVQVHIYCPGSTYWAMQVTDTGPGIPDEAQAHIFEPFWQVDGSSTRVHTGTGLGLSIVKQLTRLMDGQISLESKIGQGSTFTVLLPLLPHLEKAI